MDVEDVFASVRTSEKDTAASHIIYHVDSSFLPFSKQIGNGMGALALS